MKRLLWLLGPMLMLGGCVLPDEQEFLDERAESCGKVFSCPERTVCVQGFCVPEEREVDPTLCEPRCASYEACTALRVCRPRYELLSVRPVNDSLVGGGVVPVTAVLSLKEDSKPLYPESLEFSVVSDDGGTVETLTQLAREGGVYTAEWTAPGEGVFLLTVAHPEDGGPSTTVRLTVDQTPPTFTVTVPPMDAGVVDGGATYGDPSLANAWRRDQVVPVEIRTHEPNLDPSTVTVALRGTDGRTAPSVGVTSFTGTCDAGFCGVARLKLWEPSFAAFRGALPIVVQGSDRAGNVGGSSSTSVNVTRWKWVFDASVGGTLGSGTAPAVGAQGNVYFGTRNDSTGRVLSIRPDGSVQWDVATKSVHNGPMVGAINSGVEDVYVGFSSADRVATLIAFNGSTGAEVGRCEVDRGVITSALALTRSSSGGTPIETAVALVEAYVGTTSGTYGFLLTFRPRGSASPCRVTGLIERGQSSGPLVVDGDNVFFPDGLNRLTSYGLGSADVRAGWPVPMGSPINDLALVGSDVVGAAGAGFSGKLFSIPQAGGVSSPLWSHPSSSDLEVHPLVIGQNHDIFFGAENLPAPTSSPGLAAVTLGGNQLNVLQAGSRFNGAPVIGRDGVLYAAARDSGLVGAWSTSNATRLWTLTTDIEPTWVSPALDCARDETGAARAENLGVLYVSAGGKLYAFVVDIRGLDPNAPWPKYQHDARNTGNPATPISSCP